ncbi:hypothetical protein T01_1613 [Trichinella spiralis]|uniref:Uncharacterized protein n=1 Tax=Trichinella spiralis TaxID=6334 RepID=A0A0V1BK84_TRISP|nr:hypothetical protein T01_1613 [Trichinella spiralis]
MVQFFYSFHRLIRFSIYSPTDWAWPDHFLYRVYGLDDPESGSDCNQIPPPGDGMAGESGAWTPVAMLTAEGVHQFSIVRLRLEKRELDASCETQAVCSHSNQPFIAVVRNGSITRSMPSSVTWVQVPLAISSGVVTITVARATTCWYDNISTAEWKLDLEFPALGKLKGFPVLVEAPDPGESHFAITTTKGLLNRQGDLLLKIPLQSCAQQGCHQLQSREADWFYWCHPGFRYH